MSRQHPWPHVMGDIILISITVSGIWDHCQNLLDDPRIGLLNTPAYNFGYLAPQGQFFMGANLFIGTP